MLKYLAKNVTLMLNVNSIRVVYVPSCSHSCRCFTCRMLSQQARVKKSWKKLLQQQHCKYTKLPANKDIC